MLKQIRGLGKAGLLPTRNKSQITSTTTSSQNGERSPVRQSTNPSKLPHANVGYLHQPPPPQPTASEAGGTRSDFLNNLANHPTSNHVFIPPLTREGTATSGQPFAADPPCLPLAHGPNAALDKSSGGSEDKKEQEQHNIAGRLSERSRKRRLTEPAAVSESTGHSAGAAAAGTGGGGRAKRARGAASIDHSTGASNALKTGIKDLLRKVVEVPGGVFHVSDDVVYIADVIKPDPRRRAAVEVRFREDGSKYWFPVKDVRKWLEAQQEREKAGVSKRQLHAGVEKVVHRKTAQKHLDNADEAAAVDADVDERLAAEALTNISHGISGGAPTTSDASNLRVARAENEGIGDGKATSRLRKVSA